MLSNFSTRTCLFCKVGAEGENGGVAWESLQQRVLAVLCLRGFVACRI
jgi:hypothetical protein